MRIIFITLIFLFTLIKTSFGVEVIEKISESWNQVKSMSGDFLQTDPDGKISEGNFYFLKPYKSKFEYKNKPEIIITNQNLLKIVDREGYHIDSYPIGKNILKKILSNKIDIGMEFDVQEINLTEDSYLITLKLNRTNAEKAKFYFDKDTFTLKKWEIFDEFDNKTVLEFTKIKKNIFISEKLFVVKYRKN